MHRRFFDAAESLGVPRNPESVRPLTYNHFQLLISTTPGQRHQRRLRHLPTLARRDDRYTFLRRRRVPHTQHPPAEPPRPDRRTGDAGDPREYGRWGVARERR